MFDHNTIQQSHPLSATSDTPADYVQFTPFGDPESRMVHLGTTQHPSHTEDDSTPSCSYHPSVSSQTPSDSSYSPLEGNQDKPLATLGKHMKRIHSTCIAINEDLTKNEEKSEGNHEIRRTESFSMINLQGSQFDKQVDDYGVQFCREITSYGTQVLDLWEQFIALVKENVSLLVGELEYEYSEKLFDSFGYFIFTEHNDIQTICEKVCCLMLLLNGIGKERQRRAFGGYQKDLGFFPV